MIVLGISGGFGLVPWSNAGPFRLADSALQTSETFCHDSAAALVSDGIILAAVEEERLTRLKHTNRFALSSIQACLDEANLKPSDIDLVAYYFGEEEADNDLGLRYLDNPKSERRFSRDLLNERLSESLGSSFNSSKLRFVEHHTAHAMAAACHSGFDDGLVVVMDGQSDAESISLMSLINHELTSFRSFSEWQSLGYLYQFAIAFIGYGPFDEYKAMGLAPHGDPQRFAQEFRELYELRPDGGYEFDYTRVRASMFRAGIMPHLSGRPFTQDQKDFAAGLQSMLEDIALHIIRHAQRETGHKNLSVSGGVGLNCSLNGRLMKTGWFDLTFFDPAAHDAGAAVGAAFHVNRVEAPERFSPRRLEHVFLGPSVGDAFAVDRLREAWAPLLVSRRSEAVYEEAASLLADGAVLGWVRGRSEFGPRALGNRSILADPRPQSNVDRINLAIKKRERFRPFAPSVMAEYADEYFDIPDCAPSLDFMIAIVDVRPEHRTSLGAVTHVDGTARIQTVSREANEPFWRLLEEFRKITAIPILLNTSFNNNAEPIVQTLDDAVGCFLTAGLDNLVIDDVIFDRRVATTVDYVSFVPVLAPMTTVALVTSDGATEAHPLIHRGGRSRSISRQLYDILVRTNGQMCLGELGMTGRSDDEPVLVELMDLWAERLALVRPPR